MWNLKDMGMGWFSAIIIYVAFFGLIGCAVYITKTGTPLWALLLTPSFSTKGFNQE